MNITLGQLLSAIGVIAGAIGGITAIVAVVVKLYGKTVGKSISEAIEPLKGDIQKLGNDVNSKLKDLDVSECRNFLVRFLGDIERGVNIDPVEVERAYDVYNHYIEDLKQNTYVKDRWRVVVGNKSIATAIKKYSHKSDK